MGWVRLAEMAGSSGTLSKDVASSGECSACPIERDTSRLQPHARIMRESITRSSDDAIFR